MQTVRFLGRVAKPRTIKVGVKLDNNVETIQFELPRIATSQIATLYWTDGAGHADADLLSNGLWTIKNTLTQYPGEIMCYITISDGSTKLWHSEVFVAEIPALPAAEGRIDQVYPSAIQAGVEAAAASAAAAGDSATAAAASEAAAAVSAANAAVIAAEVLRRSSVARWKVMNLGTLTQSKAVTADGDEISIEDTYSNYGYYRIAVKPSTLYKIIGYNYYQTLCYYMTDVNGEILKKPEHYLAENYYVPQADVIMAPESAAYLYLNICTTSRTVYNTSTEATNLRPIVAEESDEDVGITISDMWNKYCPDIPLGWIASNTEYYQSKIIPVHAGDKYFVRANRYYDLVGYSCIDNAGNVMATLEPGPTDVTWYMKAIDIQSDGFLILSTDLGWDDIYWERVEDASCFGKKWYVMGDSFSELLTGRGRTKDINYVDYVAGALGLNVTNVAKGGTGYAKGSGNTFLDKASDCEGYDLVTVFGSFNDLDTNLPLGTVTDTGTTTLAGRMYNTIQTIRDTEPGATIVVIAPAPWITQNSVDGNAWGTIHPNAYVNMLKSICLRYNVPYVDLYYEGGAHPWDWGPSDDPDLTYLYDSTHYNMYGHEKYIAPMVTDGILRAMR